TTDKLGAVIEQKLGDTYAKKADIPAAKTFKAVGDGISVTEKDNVITYTLDTSKLPQSSTGVYVTEQRYNNDLKGEHIALGEGSVAFDRQKGYSGLFAAGINAVAGGKDAIAIGNQASATGNNFSIAIGSNAEAPMSNSIALGEGSIANLKLSQQGKQSYLTKEDWNGDYNGVLSLGRDLSGARAEVTRRIIHVAGGAADTDAVNVKQLKALAAKIPKAVDLSKYTTTDKLGAVIEQKLGDTYAKKTDIPAAVDLSKYTPTDKLGDVIAQKLGDTYAKKADIPAAKTFKVAGAGFSVEDKDNVVTYTLDINKLKTQLSGSSSAGTNGKSAYEVWEEYTDGNGAQPNKGKKESDFLASLKGKDGTNGTNGKSAYEVWEEHKDVNGAQPNKGKSESDFLASLKGKDGTNGITAAQLEQVSQGMQTRMAALGKHMNSVGAGNAALAALHPLEFDPDDKLEAAVGVGHYGDANAAALGMFYHPDENTLISVGGAFGKDKNVMNAGISFRVGKGGNGMLLTKTALATAVKQQNIVIHQQEERIRQLERENKARDAKLAEVLQALAQVKR
ncbi:YadA-like family protein, partial [uncultured Megasphaera sp.]|uniref:YadA-like family protein n=1 Tax=uncultured Megasphaera sp. TaxID=165188 RepID=UPI002597E38E